MAWWPGGGGVPPAEVGVGSIMGRAELRVEEPSQKTSSEH